MHEGFGAFRDDSHAIDGVALDKRAAIAPRLQPETAVLGADVLRHFIELRAWRITAAHRVVCDDADPPANVVRRDGLRGALHRSLRLQENQESEQGASTKRKGKES